jgi:hypothetical protein
MTESRKVFEGEAVGTALRQQEMVVVEDKVVEGLEHEHNAALVEAESGHEEDMDHTGEA